MNDCLLNLNIYFMRVLKTSLFVAVAMSAVLFLSCEKEIIEQPDVVVPGKSTTTAFTVTLTAKLDGVSKEELAFSKGGVLFCNKTDDAESIFRSWKDGNDEPEGCVVFQDGRIAGGEYNGTIKNLYPDTEYSYCIYLKNRDNSIREISDVLTFRTTPLTPEYQSFGTSMVRMFSAVVAGKIRMNSTDMNSCKWGLLVSETQDGKLDGNLGTISGDEVEEGEILNMTANYLSPGTDYWYRSYIKYTTYDKKEHVFYGPEYKFTTVNDEGWAIDLGLPSGILWGQAYMGVQSFESAYDLLFTDIFASYWGSTRNARVGNATYEHWDAQTQSYINIGNNIEGTRYDLVHAVMGGKWRLPTKADVEELIEYCTLRAPQETVLYYTTDEYSLRLHASYMSITGPNGRSLSTFGNPIWTGTMSENGIYPYCAYTDYNEENDSSFIALVDYVPRDEMLALRPVWDPNME